MITQSCDKDPGAEIFPTFFLDFPDFLSSHLFVFPDFLEPQ